MGLPRDLRGRSDERPVRSSGAPRTAASPSSRGAAYARFQPQGHRGGQALPIDVSFPLAKDGNRGGRLAGIGLRKVRGREQRGRLRKSKRRPPNSFWAPSLRQGRHTRFNVRDL